MQVELKIVKSIITDLIETRMMQAEQDYDERKQCDGAEDYYQGTLTALLDLRDTFGGDNYIEEELERLSHTHEKAPDSSKS